MVSGTAGSWPAATGRVSGCVGFMDLLYRVIGPSGDRVIQGQRHLNLDRPLARSPDASHGYRGSYGLRIAPVCPGVLQARYMRKWMSERLKRRKKPAEGSTAAQETAKAQEPLQPRFYDDEPASTPPPAEVPAAESRRPARPAPVPAPESVSVTGAASATSAPEPGSRTTRRRRSRGGRGRSRPRPAAATDPSAAEPS